MEEYKTKVLSVRDETPDVKTFVLQKPKDFSFIPGQYVLFSFPGEILRRPFTMTSTPSDENLNFTIKKAKSFTHRLFEILPGQKLMIDGPRGKAYNYDGSRDELVYIAGGSGITPFISNIRHIIKNSFKKKITLFFANRTKEDIIFSDELLRYRDEGKIGLINVLSSDKGDETGYITKEIIKKHLPSIRDKWWYYCGPPPMTKTVEKIFQDLDIPNERISIDRWGT